MDSDDLVEVIRVFARHRAELGGVDRGTARLGLWLGRLLHLLRRNTRGGSQRNIRSHYDLGNDFFALFLDPTFTYSCGIFEHPEASLEEASIAKYERACRKLKLTSADHVLEIGGGWGGFAIHAAQSYGCRVTTTTISDEQRELAEQRVKQANLTDRVRVLALDYRDLEGLYDKLVSIEMIEAVGHEYLETFFHTCSDRLRPDGVALIQAITTTDQNYDASRRSTDFIKRYIFPGGQLPSLGAIQRAVGRATDLRLVHLEDLTPHYVRTLGSWRKRFLNRIEDAKQQGLSKEFIRMWDFYLAYCQGGFAERTTGVAQLVFEKPFGRGDFS